MFIPFHVVTFGLRVCKGSMLASPGLVGFSLWTFLVHRPHKAVVSRKRMYGCTEETRCCVGCYHLGVKPEEPEEARGGPAEEGFPEGCLALGSVSLRPAPSLQSVTNLALAGRGRPGRPECRREAKFGHGLRGWPVQEVECGQGCGREGLHSQ